jgi:TPR repeat protein
MHSFPESFMKTLLCAALLAAMFSDTAVAAPTETLQDAQAAIQAGDKIRALGIYTMLAQEGNAKAEYNLGQMYISGDGVPQDVDEAQNWYRRSAEHGYSEAQYTLGALHFRQVAALKSHEEAVEWYRKAAEQGHARSQLNLGDLYFKGEVVQQDVPTALEWYRRSAVQGNGEAQHHLGVIYGNGEGVAKDPVTGFMWLTLAAENAEPRNRMRTAKILRFTETTLTPAQLEEGRARAARCKESNYQQC